ncbi:MAG TPA: heterocyst frequency control protein PatD [Coleofasciculaceae cyanobacterium]
MLPEYRQLYQSFRHRLQQLQAQIGMDPSALHPPFQDVQTFFHQKILPGNLETLDATEAAKIQSFQVEINKQLRLLGTDLMFLQAARLSATQSQRQQQISQRLDLLLRYCEAVLAEEEGQ